MEIPFVSVNMPVYNGEAYIMESIESILSQTFSDFELIIVNDGSTDNTVAIIEQFNDPRIKIVHNSHKSGLAHVRNTAIKESRGKYIAIIDSDDIAYPERLQLQVDFLEKNVKYCLVCGWSDSIDSYGNITRVDGYKYLDNEIPSVLFFHNCIAQSSVMLRKSMLPSMEPYHPDFPPAEDYHLWIQLAKRYPMHIIKKPLIKYRVHTNNTSSQNHEHTDRVVRNILKMQCEELGLSNLSDDELGLQLALVYNCYNGEREFITKLNKFYREIIKANGRLKKYPPAVFERMIKKYMYKPLRSFFIRKQYGNQELKDLFGSTVNAASYLSVNETVKIMMKSAIKYRPAKLIGNNK